MKTCPHCDAILSEAIPHDCMLPKLMAAIGDVELSERERKMLRWIAKDYALSIHVISIINKVRAKVS